MLNLAAGALLSNTIHLGLVLDDLLERLVGQTTDRHLPAINHQGWRLIDIEGLG